MPSPSLAPKFRRCSAVRSAKVGEEQVLLHLGRGHYFALNPTAAWIWEQLAQPRSLEELRSEMTEIYEVEGDEARMDIEGLVAELLSESLIEPESPAG